MLDLAVYAPLGFALERRRVVGELADRGRRQIAFAKMVGRTALTVTAGDILRAFREPTVEAAPAPPELVAADRVAEEPPPEPAGPPEGTPDASSLAIPDYDSLAAKHVVRRLSGLTPAELESVRLYESAHRGRRTILGRIDQLRT